MLISICVYLINQNGFGEDYFYDELFLRESVELIPLHPRWGLTKYPLTLSLP